MSDIIVTEPILKNHKEVNMIEWRNGKRTGLHMSQSCENRECPICACTYGRKFKDKSQLEFFTEEVLPIMRGVHNHGYDPSCRERIVDGKLTGECMMHPEVHEEYLSDSDPGDE